ARVMATLPSPFPLGTRSPAPPCGASHFHDHPSPRPQIIRSSPSANWRSCRLPSGRHDAENDWVPNDGDWQEPQKQEEGRGWAKPTSDLSDNTYTGKGGSKRD